MTQLLYPISCYDPLALTNQLPWPSSSHQSPAMAQLL